MGLLFIFVCTIFIMVMFLHYSSRIDDLLPIITQMNKQNDHLQKEIREIQQECALLNKNNLRLQEEIFELQHNNGNADDYSEEEILAITEDLHSAPFIPSF